MRKQNIELLNADGSHRCWVSRQYAKQRARLGEMRRVSRRKDPREIYRITRFRAPITADEIEKKSDSWSGLQPDGPASRIFAITVDSNPSRVNGGLCNGK
jgi:hypothetical protein